MTRRRRRRRRRNNNATTTTLRSEDDTTRRRQHHATTKGRGGARATLDETRRAIEHETRDRSSCPTTSPEDVFVAATARSHQDLDAAAQRARCRIGKGIGEGTGEVGMVGGVEGGGEDGRVDEGGLDVHSESLSRKMRGLRRNQRRKFTRTTSGRTASGSNQKESGINYAALREENNLLQTANAQQITAAIVPAKARSPLSKVKRDRIVLRARNHKKVW